RPVQSSRLPYSTLFRSFIEEEFYLFTSPNHPLAQEEIVTVTQLNEEKFIVFNQDFALHKLIIHYCEQAGFEPTIAYKSSQWDLIDRKSTRLNSSHVSIS